MERGIRIISTIDNDELMVQETNREQASAFSLNSLQAYVYHKRICNKNVGPRKSHTPLTRRVLSRRQTSAVTWAARKCALGVGCVLVT